MDLVYGRPLEDHGLRARLDAGEVVLGGCVSSELSPAYLLVCQECGYRFDPVTECWERDDPDPSTFDRPLSAAVRNFPPPDPPHRRQPI